MEFLGSMQLMKVSTYLLNVWFMIVIIFCVEIIEATVDYVLKLELNTITAASGGEYVCIVINDAGMEFSTSSLFVKPYITEHPMDPVKANFSDELTLSCSADSFPQSTFQWQKEFQDIPGENSTVLVLQELTFLDTGLYRCGASITINNTNFTTYSKNALVIGKELSLLVFICI